MAPGLLERKLLPEHFQFAHHHDSAYIRDFVGDIEDWGITTYLSHGLENTDPDLLKKKLDVDFIYWEPQTDTKQFEEDDFDLVYATWMETSDFPVFWNLFSIKQVEEMTLDKRSRYRREVTYRWYLFFWEESQEFVQAIHCEPCNWR